MASLQTPLLRPFHHLPEDSFMLNTHKLNIFPPKFEPQSSPTSTNLSCKRKLIITHNSSQIISLLESTKKRTRQQEEYSSTSRSNEVDYFGSIVDKLMSSRSCSFDCKQIHGQLVKLGAIESDYMVGNRLALLYIKNGDLLDDARQVFDKLPERTYPLYCAIIGSYSRAGKWVEVFHVLGLMILDELMPDVYLVPTILKACGAREFLKYGQMIHGFVLRRHTTDLFVGNGLIDFYSKCGELDYTKRTFDMMHEKDVVSWTALISAYMNEELPYEAYEVFKCMHLNGVNPDQISWNAIVSGFARNGDIKMAFRLMEEMQEAGLNPKVTTWNGLISGCVHTQYHSDAMDLFRTMFLYQKPNAVTLVSILQACGSLKAFEIGKAIHGYAIKTNLCGNIFLQGSLIDMYAKSGKFDDMETVFRRVTNKNTSLWNSMISGYVKEGKLDNALGVLESMKNEGFLPDEVTYNTLLSGHSRKGNKNEAYVLVSEMEDVGLKPNMVTFNVLISGFQQSGLTREALKVFRTSFENCFFQPNHVTVTGALAACADLSLSCHGKAIHGYVMKNGFNSSVFVSSALVDMYGKCHDMNSATKVFNHTEYRNAVVWNSLLAAYIQNSDPEEAIKLVPEMLNEGVDPNLVTFLTVLPVCGDLEDLKLGISLHGLLVKTQFLDLDVDLDLHDSLTSSLVDMYTRCNYRVQFSRL